MGWPVKALNHLNAHMLFLQMSPQIRVRSQKNKIRLKKAGQEIIPSQRFVGDKLLLEIPRHELSSGFYELEVGTQSITTLAFNTDQKESVLDQLPEKELLQIFGEIPQLKIFNTGDIDNFGTELKENYMGKPLWRYALILALFFLLVEVLFIRFL